MQFKVNAGGGVAREGSGRNSQPRGGVELFIRSQSNKRGADVRLTDSSKGHFDVLHPSTNDVVITPAGRSNQTLRRFVVLLQSLTALLHFPGNAIRQRRSTTCNPARKLEL